MINVGDFSVSRLEITKEIWDCVSVWAKKHGYTDLCVGSGKAKQSVGCINWYDAVKFTNALSEFCGRHPCYYIGTEIYKTGKYDLNESDIRNTNGYRLPMAAEWEYACRGGTITDYFWGDEFIALPENEYAWCGTAYESGLVHEVGLRKPNPFGLYDMSGNVFEWCFDKHLDIYRVMMGGSVAFDSDARSNVRSFTAPEYKCYETGLRVFSSDQNADGYEEKVHESCFWGVYNPPRPEYEDLSYDKLAEKLCVALADTPDALYVKEAKNNAKELLHRFRDLFFRKLGKVELNHIFLKSGQDFEKEVEHYLEYDFHIRWYGKTGERDMHHILDKMVVLSRAYEKNGDLRYLRKMMELYRSMLIRFKTEFDCLDDEMLSQKHQTEQTWAWNNGFEPHHRAANILSSFLIAYNVGCDIKEFPCEIVAGIALFLMNENMYPMIKDGRQNIFNQLMQCSNVILKQLEVFSDFKTAPVIKQVVEERLNTGLAEALRPDGTALEQSFMYNRVTLNSFASMEKYITDVKIKKMMEYLLRYLVVTIPPVGGEIATATSHGEFPYEDESQIEEFKQKQLQKFRKSKGLQCIEWKDRERILNALFANGKDAPKFLNVHFPYGGVTVIRSGWTFESQMLSLFAPPCGRGHAAANINDIQLWDYGMPILVNAGWFSYGIKEYFPEEQQPYMKGMDAYQLSSYSRNTVVSGKTQKRLEKGENNLRYNSQITVGCRYYESDNFVYTEGIYEDGYIDSTAVLHKRKIIYERENKLIFVLDLVKSVEMEEFTQVWQFMPKTDVETGPGFQVKYTVAGYTPEEIVTDEKGIYTTSASHPNVFLYQFSEQALEIERKYGELSPASGWFIPFQQSRRVPKTDIRTKWKSSGEASVLTMITTSTTTKSIINEIKKTQQSYEVFLKNGQSISVDFAGNGDISVRKRDAYICVKEHGSSYAEENGAYYRVSAPYGFKWREKNGYSIPILEEDRNEARI